MSVSGSPPVASEPDEVVDVHVDDGVHLHTRRWRGPTEPWFLLLHGLSSNARLWDGVASVLAAAGHGVVAVDLRGHGQASKPLAGYDLTTVTDDLAVLLDELATGGGPFAGPPVVVGQSWGGNVAIELGVRAPGRARALACIDGGSIDLQERFGSWEECAAALRPPRLVGTPVDDLEAMVRRSHPSWPESGIRGTMACFEVRPDGTVAPHLDLDRHLLVLRGLWDHRPSERYGRIREPVLFLNADVPDEAGPEQREWRRTKEEGMQRAQRALARVRVEWMVGDHDLHAQHPRRVADLLRDFAGRPPEGR